MALGLPPAVLPSAYDSIRRHLGQRLVPRTDPPVVLVTARQTGEGASTTSVGLARACAGNGLQPVLLLGEAGRRGVIRRFKEGGRRRIGSTRALPAAYANGHPVEVFPTADDRIDLGPANAADDGGATRAALSNGWQGYRLIIVDGGSLEEDRPYLIKPLASFTLLVVNARTTTLPALRRLDQVLRARHFEVDGIVLNRRKLYIPKFLYGLTR